MNPTAFATRRAGSYGVLALIATSIGIGLSGLGPRVTEVEKYLPHGFCYQWQPDLIRLHLISDALIGLAYISIPLTLLYFVRKRTDLPFNWMFVLFGVFIVACGSTHWMEVWTLWQPNYWAAGYIKAVTAAASIPTAIVLVGLMPSALALPSAEQLRHANEALESEIAERLKAEAALRDAQANLEQRVAQRTSELAAANDELNEQRNRLQADDKLKDEFIAILSHELRNPLQVVATSAQLLDLDGTAPPETKKACASIERQVLHMGHLLRDLLDVSRFKHGLISFQFEPSDLRHIVESCAEEHRAALGNKGQRLELSLPDHPVHMQADPARLQQMISNLLHNASKYTDSGGLVSLSLSTTDGKASIVVQDSGMGIPATELDDLFNLFSQGNMAKARAEGGLGIGLYVAKAIAESHGGTINVTSDGAGLGARFEVRLPVDAEVRQPGPSDAIGYPLRQLRILVVDDNAEATQTIAALLRARGHQVETAYDGQEALDKAHAQRPEVALIDIGLPRLNGHQLAAEIRRSDWGRGARLVALTGWGSAGDQSRSLGAGFDLHLTKPVSLANLLNALAPAGTAPASGRG